MFFKGILIFISVVYSFTSFSQSIFKFDELFYLAKDYLAKGEIGRATSLFEKLLLMDSANANTHYLLGVCYALDSLPDSMSLYHLEKGIAAINLNYDAGSPHEKTTPIFVYFFLTMAYNQHDRCEDALQASKKFHVLYGLYKDDYYTSETQHWVEECAGRHPPPSGILQPDYHKIETQSVNYTTPAALYGVQIGAYSKFIPLWEFEKLKNVDAYMDTTGMIRYVIGHFSLRSQAETVRTVIQSGGVHNDAFVVDVNKASKYKQQIISVDGQPVDKKLAGRVDFSVQLGAFRDSIPVNLVLLYMKIDGIKEYREGELTLMTSGKFETYEESKTFRDQIVEMGVPGAFIIALNQHHKVPLKQAITYSKKKLEKKEKKKIEKEKQ